MVGQSGAIQTQPNDASKEVPVQRIAIYAEPGADDCKVRTAMSFRRPDGVALPQPVFVGPTDGGAAYDVPMGRGVLQIDCSMPGVGWETRRLETEFDEVTQQDVVTAATLGAVVFGGPFATASTINQYADSPTWPQFNSFPPIVHVVSSQLRKDPEAMAALRTAAGKRWDTAFTALRAQCAISSRPRINACNEEMILRLRVEDEAYINGTTPPARPASVQPES